MATELMYLGQNSIPLKRLKGKTVLRKNVSEMQDLDTLQLFTKTFNSECVIGFLLECLRVFKRKCVCICACLCIKYIGLSQNVFHRLRHFEY